MIQPILRSAASLGTGGFKFDSSRSVTSGSAGLTRCIWPVAGVFRNLATRLTVVPGGGNTRTLTLEVNNTNSALATAHGAADTYLEETATDVTVAVGDRIRMVSSATGSPSTTDLAWAIDFVSTNTRESGYTSQIASTTDTFFSPFTGEENATRSFVDIPVPCPGSFTAAVAANTFGSVGSGVHYRIWLYKNGVKQDGTGGTVNTECDLNNVAVDTPVSVTFNLPVVRGDLISCGIEVTGGSFTGWATYGLAFTATTDGESILAGGGSNNPSTSADNVCRLIDDAILGWGTETESHRLRCGVTSFYLRDFTLALDTDPGGSASRRFRLRKNNAYPTGGPDITITAGGSLDAQDLTGETAFATGDAVGPLGHTPTSTPTVTGDEWWSFTVDVNVNVDPPGTGGNPGTGTNPTDGNLPSSLPLVFVYVKLIDGTVYSWAEVWGRLHDPSTYFGGEKQARILGLGRILTEFSRDGVPRTYTWTTELSDHDGVLRAASAAGALKGAYIAAYVVDDAVRRAQGTPFRFAAGYITSAIGKEPMRFLLQAEGALGRKLGRINQQPKIPSHVLTAAEFPGLDTRREGKSVHVPLGAVSDEAKSTPEGVIPWQFCGTANLQGFCGGGAASVTVDCYLLGEGAMGWIYDSYFTVREWGQEEAVVVGDLIRPADETAYYYVATVAGTTGTSQPTWPTGVAATVTDGGVTWQRGDALNTLTRIRIPADAYGTALVMPFKPGWAAATGLTTNYVDLGTPTRRYTFAFVLHTHPYARAIREGRIQVATNGIGLTDQADGLGLVFTDPAEIAQWVLVNEGFATCLYTSYASIPTFDAPEGTYTIVDTASVQACRALGVTWLGGEGVTGAMMLGRDGNQQKLFDLLREMTAGGYFKLGENRHGQLTFHRHNPSATPTVTYTAADILDGSLEFWQDQDGYANHVRHYSGYRYERQKQVAGTPSSEWANPVTDEEDTTAQTDVGETVSIEVNNYVVRDETVVEEIAERTLAASVGPAASRDGAWMQAFTTRWQGLGKGGVSVDLGTCISVTHPEARVSTAQSMVVEGREVDALKGTIRLTCRVL